MSKVNNRKTRASCEICSKVTIKTPKRRHLWTYFTPCSNVSIVDFEQVNTNWAVGGNMFLIILNILFARNRIFAMWIETELSLSSSPINYECFSFKMIRKYLSRNLFILAFCYGSFIYYARKNVWNTNISYP